MRKQFCICGLLADSECSACEAQGYCSAECQENHWPEHFLVCQPPIQHPGASDDAHTQLDPTKRASPPPLSVHSSHSSNLNLPAASDQPPVVVTSWTDLPRPVSAGPPRVVPVMPPSRPISARPNTGARGAPSSSTTVLPPPSRRANRQESESESDAEDVPRGPRPVPTAAGRPVRTFTPKQGASLSTA